MSDYIEGGNTPLQEGSNLDDFVSGKYVAKNTGSNTPMNSYILRDAAVNEIYHHFPSLSHVEATMVLYTIPSADVVEVVRCKDCENWEITWTPKYGGYHYCPMIDLGTDENFYCSKGERRTDG